MKASDRKHSQTEGNEIPMSIPSSYVPAATAQDAPRQPPARPRALPRETVTVRPAPRREPPFDDELAESGASLPGRFDRQLPFPRPAARTPLRVAARRGDLPDPVPWARRLLVGVVEASAGRRPMQQLVGMLSPSILAGLRTEFSRAHRTGGRHWIGTAAVQTVTGCEPTDGVAEMCATLRTRSRTRAIAFRAELHHGAWRCVRLQIG